MHNKKIKRTVDFSAFCVAVWILLNNSFLEFSVGNLYYLFLGSFFPLMLLLGKKSSLKISTLSLILVCFLSILMNDIPDFFRPYQRFLAFLTIIVIIGPLYSNTALESFRRSLFFKLNLLILILVVISFMGLIFDVPFVHGRSGFNGFFNHSMLLGPLAIVACLTSMSLYSKSSSKTKRGIFIAASSISFLTCLAAGSRVALMSGIVALLFYFYKMNQGKMSKFFRTIVFIISCAVMSFPIWKDYTDRLTHKIYSSKEAGSITNSRNSLWENRITEFNSSPIYGVGFVSVNTKLSNKYDELTGSIEPGSSWLAILSMTGLLGFLIFLRVLSPLLLFIYKEEKQSASQALLGSLLIFFMIHMSAEGYIYSAGSGLFFYFWLLLSIIYLKKSRIKRSIYNSHVSPLDQTYNRKIFQS